MRHLTAERDRLARRPAGGARDRRGRPRRRARRPARAGRRRRARGRRSARRPAARRAGPGGGRGDAGGVVRARRIRGAAEAAAAALDPEVLRSSTATVGTMTAASPPSAPCSAEPGAAEVMTQPEPDLDGLGAAHQAASTPVERPRPRRPGRSPGSRRITASRVSWTTHLAEWAPAASGPRARHPAGGVRRGQVSRQPAADAALGVRRSGYRLSQVVAAANERLAAMSDQRYSLEHTGRAGRRRDRAAG